MNKSLLISTTAAILAFSTAAEARISSDSELRGYNNCVAAAKDQSNGLVTARHYFLDKSGENTMYYVNATRWEGGERNYIRVACETAARGHKVVSADIENGRFDNESTRVTVEIAQQ